MITLLMLILSAVLIIVGLLADVSIIIAILIGMLVAPYAIVKGIRKNLNDD